MSDHDFPYQTGWIDDGGHELIAADLPVLATDAPDLLPTAEPSKPIRLYRAWWDVTGNYPDYPAQQIGDCVSFGHGHANDLLQCVEIALGEPSEYRETDTEFIYATSREVAGILGRGDGSYGAAAAKAMLNMGIVSREMLGSDGAYSGSRAKSWGRTGAPSDVKAKAGPYRLGAVARVTTWGSLVAALWNGFPVSVCSNWGFTMTRDAQGFCRPRGTWAHCMFFAGARFDRPGACCTQSWGSDTPSGPLDLEQPSYSFWIDKQYVERMLAAGDSWALSRSPEFVKRPLPADWSQA